MTDPERLRELAYTLGSCEWDHPLGSADLCRRVADELERRETPDCIWTYDEAYEKYDTNCGASWQFIDGRVRENGVRYCHKCGRCVREAKGGA